MTYQRTIVCLSASVRNGGRCVAGKMLEQGKFGEWVRPVSQGPNYSLPCTMLSKDNGERADVLDVLTVTLERPVPVDHQTENHVVSNDVEWIHKGYLSYGQLLHGLDNDIPSLWLTDTKPNSKNTDRVALIDINQFQRSLLLAGPFLLEIRVARKYGKKKWRGLFDFKGTSYNLAITDPWVSSEFAKVGTYKVEEAILCISLAEPYGNYCYKLIAAVIVQQRERG